jgi:hypothetical protein
MRLVLNSVDATIHEATERPWWLFQNGAPVACSDHAISVFCATSISQMCKKEGKTKVLVLVRQVTVTLIIWSRNSIL